MFVQWPLFQDLLLMFVDFCLVSVLFWIFCQLSVDFGLLAKCPQFFGFLGVFRSFLDFLEFSVVFFGLFAPCPELFVQCLFLCVFFCSVSVILGIFYSVSLNLCSVSVVFRIYLLGVCRFWMFCLCLQFFVEDWCTQDILQAFSA